jgi:hypothetical protein
MSLKPLLFLCAVALLARARVLPQESQVEDKPALKLLAERGASNFDAWVQIQKLSEKVKKSHPRSVCATACFHRQLPHSLESSPDSRARTAKNQEVISARAEHTLGNVTGGFSFFFFSAQTFSRSLCSRASLTGSRTWASHEPCHYAAPIWKLGGRKGGTLDEEICS